MKKTKVLTQYEIGEAEEVKTLTIREYSEANTFLYEFKGYNSVFLSREELKAFITQINKFHKQK